MIEYSYLYGPLKVGVQFGDQLSPLTEKLIEFYAPFKIDNSGEKDHICTITLWEQGKYIEPENDILTWSGRKLKIETTRNIAVDAQWDKNLDCNIKVYEGNNPIKTNDLLRYWEFSQRISIYPKLIKANAMLLHCSAFAVNNKAYIFIGPGGAGKSTIAMAAEKKGYTVITDDTAILEFKENKIIAYASPYKSKSGIIGSKGSWEVNSFYVLNKEHEESISEINIKDFTKNLQERIYESQYWAHLFPFPSRNEFSRNISLQMMKNARYISTNYETLQYNFPKECDFSLFEKEILQSRRSIPVRKILYDA